MICWKTLKRRFSRHKMLDQNTTSQLLKIKNVSLIQVAMVTHLPREIAGEKTMRVTIASRCLQSDHKWRVHRLRYRACRGVIKILRCLYRRRSTYFRMWLPSSRRNVHLSSHASSSSKPGWIRWHTMRPSMWSQRRDPSQCSNTPHSCLKMKPTLILNQRWQEVYLVVDLKPQPQNKRRSVHKKNSQLSKKNTKLSRHQAKPKTETIGWVQKITMKNQRVWVLL